MSASFLTLLGVVGAVSIALAVAARDYFTASLMCFLLTAVFLSTSQVAVLKIMRVLERALTVVDDYLRAWREAVSFCEFCGNNRYARRPCCMKRALQDAEDDGKLAVRTCPTCGLRMSYFDSHPSENCPRCQRPFPVGVPRAEN